MSKEYQPTEVFTDRVTICELAMRVRGDSVRICDDDRRHYYAKAGKVYGVPQTLFAETPRFPEDGLTVWDWNTFLLWAKSHRMIINHMYEKGDVLSVHHALFTKEIVVWSGHNELGNNDHIETIHGDIVNTKFVIEKKGHLDDKELFEKRLELVFKRIPKPFHNAIRDYANNRWSDLGYEDRLNFINELVEMLIRPIEEFESDCHWKHAD